MTCPNDRLTTTVNSITGDLGLPMTADAVFSNNTDTGMYDVFGRSYTLNVSLEYQGTAGVRHRAISIRAWSRQWVRIFYPIGDLGLWLYSTNSGAVTYFA